MNSKLVDTYTIRLIRENIIYIGLLIFFICIVVLYIPLQVIHYFDNVKRNAQVTNDIDASKAKEAVIATYQPSELNQLVSTLNQLIPSNEDYFSILTTLDQLSKKTGFSISAYKITVPKKSTGEVQLAIIGEGTTDSLVQFLNQYRAGGGRLMTINKIDFSTQVTKVAFSTFFYSRNFKANNNSNNNIKPVNPDLLQKLGKLSSLQSQGANQTTTAPDLNYQVKENPFGQ